MKKHLAVILILTMVILISAGSVSASGQTNDTEDVDLKIDFEREEIDYIEFDTPVTYRITVENTKSVAENTSVRICSYNLEHLSYEGIGSYSINYNSNSTGDSAIGDWKIGNLSANQNATLFLMVKPTQYFDFAYIDFEVLTDSNDLNLTDNYKDDDFLINLPDADLKVSVESDIANPYLSNTPIIFNVTVENRRFLAENVTLAISTHNVIFTDYKLSTGNFSSISNPHFTEYGTWYIGDLDTNQTATLNLFAKAVRSYDYAYIDFSADTYSHDSNTSDNNRFIYFDVHNPVTDLVIEFREHGAKRDYDGSFNFTVYARNIYGIANDVKVKITYPSWVTDIKFYPSKGSFNKKTGIWNIGTLYEFEIASIKIVGKSDENFDIFFSATTSSTELDDENNFLRVWVVEIGNSHHVTRPKDRRNSEQRSFYSTSQYSDYRELTNASQDNETKPAMGNSIIGDVNPIFIGAVLILLILINKRRNRIDF